MPRIGPHLPQSDALPAARPAPASPASPAPSIGELAPKPAGHRAADTPRPRAELPRDAQTPLPQSAEQMMSAFMQNFVQNVAQTRMEEMQQQLQSMFQPDKDEDDEEDPDE